MQNKPVMFWERVNPFDIYWSPGASALSDAAIIQRVRYTRADLNDLLGVPGYDETAVRGALTDYAHGSARVAGRAGSGAGDQRGPRGPVAEPLAVHRGASSSTATCRARRCSSRASVRNSFPIRTAIT